MIWCVDDDKTICDIEVYALIQTGFEARGFLDGVSMLKELKNEKPQLIILDVMLPDKDGMAVLKELKSNNNTKDIPVIMATAKNSEIDKVNGLDSGADDYLVKPFGVMEMVSRVKAVLRRVGVNVNETDCLTIGDISLYNKEHIVKVKDNKVNLTLKEYELLKLFMENPGVVFTRNQLLSLIWSTDFFGESRTVDMHIKNLRQKLGDCGKCIETVIGVGYRMEKQ